MEKPWLSVIIPSHNGERWLGTALASLAAQREPGIEVIVIDTSADEASLRIVDSYSGRLNIRVHRRPQLRQWTAKTNFGVEHAGGEWICMLHQDDFWLPNRSAELRRWLTAQPDAVMHLHPCYIVDESGRRLGRWRCPLPDGDRPVPEHILFERLLVQNFIAIPAPTIRRGAFLAVGGLDERLWYTADWDLYLKIAAAGNIYYHSNPLACFRIHKDSLTISGSRNNDDFRKQQEIVLRRHIEKISLQYRRRVLRVAAASIDVNSALAAIMAGRFARIIKAFMSVLALGPRGMHRYFFCSRIIDRAFPRLRALFAGRF